MNSHITRIASPLCRRRLKTPAYPERARSKTLFSNRTQLQKQQPKDHKLRQNFNIRIQYQKRIPAFDQQFVQCMIKSKRADAQKSTCSMKM